MIINNLRVPVTKLREGDLFVAIHQLPTNPPSAHAVVAEVREVSHWDGEYTVHYTATDKPSGMCYGSDVTYRRRDHVTVITTN
jgi:hypothetical protein